MKDDDDSRKGTGEMIRRERLENYGKDGRGKGRIGGKKRKINGRLRIRREYSSKL
jgi:hypothetical protein